MAFCRPKASPKLKFMRLRTLLTTTLILFFAALQLTAKEQSYSLTIKVTIAENIKESIITEGRLFVFFSKNSRAGLHTRSWPTPGNYVFAKNMSALQKDEIIEISAETGLMTTASWSLNQVPAGTHYLQIVWDQDKTESRIDAPGNIYSEMLKVEMDKDAVVDISLSKIVEPRKVNEHKFVKEITMKSEALSKFWGKEVNLKASVLLPNSYYDQPNASYPVRYNIAGYGGRYTRINRLLNEKNFTEWWLTDEAPQIINVFLDGEGPYGDSYQLDSENNGPYGEALIKELIPYIESNYRGKQDPKYRFVDGCSTGGWVSLALQLFYPDEFNGVWAYSPDALDFVNYQLINIYKDKNAFVNEYGIDRPVARTTKGEPLLLLKDFIQHENVLGWSDTYLTSGGQFSAHAALYSPKGEDGLPKPLFDPETGAIDEAVAEYWKNYDLKLYAEENWQELGPKIQGKVYIWMGDMDQFYLNTGTRSFDDFLRKTKDPVSDAEIIFVPMGGHCDDFSHKKVLEKMNEKLEEID